ncbi:hydroxyquinol 1,2-dioxygenase [Leucobacter weissii]|uniref:Hydroxyquinol 1,2-dioxygenase n=1 Tax=Leucobacter weissii TaxID=1983706 RepID=A0A939SBT5_9MICO|nr:dioxygenase [Leucobacter weissii]MBO1901765.1 hydroxyquinol 1,2-dioxygenase [Leucobacter weissii]
MTSDLRGRELTEQVVRSFAETPDPRLRQVLESLARHLHAFVNEVSPTIEEWEAGIDFLTRTGQTCTDVRQEFILFSDVLGVSMLVETINDAETPDATDSTVLGPFHMVESPARALGDDVSPQSRGETTVVRGRVVDTTGRPVPGAVIDVWQANAEGFYDVQQSGVQEVGNGRGLFRADEEGRFWFRTIIPAHYPIPTDGPVGELLVATRRHPYRPAHIHFIVDAPGYRELTTHIFVAGSEYIDSDAVFAVKDSLVKSFEPVDSAELAADFGVTAPFRLAGFDIVLHTESED